MTSEVEQSSRGYPFLETQRFVEGRDYSLAVMHRGILVGSRIFIVALDGGNNNNAFSVGIGNLAEGQRLVTEAMLHKLSMLKFRRYEYVDLESGEDVLLRIARRYDKTVRKSFMSFNVDTPLSIVRADKKGITFERTGKTS